MLRTFIQVTALILTLESAIFLTLATLGLSPKTIALLSMTMWGQNPAVAKSLTDQGANTRVGVFLLLIAFTLQMWNLFWPVRFDDFGIDKRGVVLGVLVSLLLGIGGYYLSSVIAGRTFRDVQEIFRSLDSRKPKQRMDAAP